MKCKGGQRATELPRPHCAVADYSFLFASRDEQSMFYAASFIAFLSVRQ